jgi:hypothetical protein
MNCWPIGNWLAKVKNLFELPLYNKNIDMEQLLDVVNVTTHPGYRLELNFENGEKRLFDMTPYLQKKPFSSLQNISVFICAAIDYGTVVWPGNIDISPETLYDQSIPFN